MHMGIMYTLHMVSILVNNPVKYSVYYPVAGEVYWDTEVTISSHCRSY